MCAILEGAGRVSRARRARHCPSQVERNPHSCQRQIRYGSRFDSTNGRMPGWPDSRAGLAFMSASRQRLHSSLNPIQTQLCDARLQYLGQGASVLYNAHEAITRLGARKGAHIESGLAKGPRRIKIGKCGNLSLVVACVAMASFHMRW